MLYAEGTTFVAIDFETATSRPDSACAVGLVACRHGSVVRSRGYLIRPPSRRFTFSGIHGFSWEDVRDAPSFEELWPALRPWLGPAQFLAAHNAAFDQEVLHACCDRYGLTPPRQRFVCTVEVARQQWEISPTDLPSVCERLGIPVRHHDAESDALACAQVVLAAEARGWRSTGSRTRASANRSMSRWAESWPWCTEPGEQDDKTSAATLTAMPQLTDNPFTPGAGLTPAYMGRRPEVEGELLRILGAARSGRSGAHAALLFGPRGNGKTVLLNWFQRQARGGDGGEPVPVVRFSSRDLGDPERTAEAIRIAATGWTTTWERLRNALSGASVSIPPFSVQVGDGGGERLRSALRRWLAQGRGPLVLTVDEAHVAVPRALGDFLDAVQIAGDERPVAVVLAGTPGVLRTLDDADTSFWSRFRKLRVGLLSDEAAFAVLAEPLRAAGTPADEVAADALARAADNYPYFLQLHGEAAWDALAESGADRFSADRVPSALDAVRNQRRLYYADRHAEFRRENLLPLARDVALAFRDAAAGALAMNDLHGLLARYRDAAARNPADLEDFLAAKGYIWQTEDGSAWVPGIPSLMDYMVELTE